MRTPPTGRDRQPLVLARGALQQSRRRTVAGAYEVFDMPAICQRQCAATGRRHIAGISKTPYVRATPHRVGWRCDLPRACLRRPLPCRPPPACRPPRRLGMIPLSLSEIAKVVGGVVEGDDAVMVTAPAVL